jgi:hypothetical protein
MGEVLARLSRACAACALLRETRTTDSLRPVRLTYAAILLVVGEGELQPDLFAFEL